MARRNHNYLANPGCGKDQQAVTAGVVHFGPGRSFLAAAEGPIRLQDPVAALRVIWPSRSLQLQ